MAPNVSVIDGREILQTIKTVVDNVTLAVTVVGSLVVLSGLLILIGAVAMTKFRRIYEAAIFKTLGATRRLIASVLLFEYGLLGALAGRDRVARARSALTWGDQPLRAGHPVHAAAAAITLGGVVAHGGAGGGHRRRCRAGTSSSASRWRRCAPNDSRRRPWPAGTAVHLPRRHRGKIHC